MRPDPLRSRLIAQWIGKAERDLLAADRSAFGEPPLSDIAAYHWQQAAEKALKAFLTAHDRPFRRLHDLSYLVQQCEEIDAEFARFREAVVLLTPFASEFRYPGPIEEPSAEAADAARALARDVVAFVKARLPVETGEDTSEGSD